MATKISKSAKTDLQLIESFKEGNEIAFSRLYNKYHDSMVFHFRKMVNDGNTAEELVIEAFTKVSSNLEKFNNETAVFSTWLFKLTQNLFIDKLRRKKEEALSITDLSVSDGETIEFEIPEYVTPETEMLKFERDAKINKVLDSLKNEEIAEVVKMRFFDNMSYEEIGQKLNKPISTVKTYLYRSKEILKKEFQKENISL